MNGLILSKLYLLCATVGMVRDQLYTFTVLERIINGSDVLKVFGVQVDCFQQDASQYRLCAASICFFQIADDLMTGNTGIG